MAGLIDSSKPVMGGKYDDLVELKPEDDPLQGSEPANEEEQAHYDNMFADFIDLLYGPQRDNALKMMKTTPDLFQGVSQASFVLLKGVYDEHTRKEGPVPQAALFGEGGMIGTAVDEMFKLAAAHKLKGSDDINQYTAAQMDIMRRVGDYLEKEQSDDSVNEAQDLLMDIEVANNPNVEAAPIGTRDEQDLAAIQYQEEARRPGGGNENPAAMQEQAPAASVPAEMGLV